MLGVQSVIVGFWVVVGFCDEELVIYGFMYFFEYLFFKGMVVCIVFDIVVVFDQVGGEYNVMIVKEYICYYVKVCD